jgi:hypothetical protein
MSKKENEQSRVYDSQEVSGNKGRGWRESALAGQRAKLRGLGGLKGRVDQWPFSAQRQKAWDEYCQLI